MSWRLEPTPRAPGIEEGLAARVHDPLWLLTRQWQLGEFHAQDAGTPAIVRVAGNTTAVNAWRGGGQASWTPFDSGLTPIDALVEPEDETAPSLRERIEAGAHFQRLLVAAGFGRYTNAFLEVHAFDANTLADEAFAADPLFAAVARRTPDGLALHATAATIAGGGAPGIAIDPGDVDGVTAAAKAWLAWYDDEIHLNAGAGTAVTWKPHRMEYGFELSSAAGGGTVMSAEAYLGDGLDWFDFDVEPGAAPAAGAAAVPIDRKAVPAPVRYGGMPLPRFWAMEDALYDFGSVDAAGQDVGRLLLVEFATVFGNDWYVLPIKLASASLTILDSVVISDVFGRNLLVNRAGADEPQWNLFSLTIAGGGTHPAQSALFLPPTADIVTDGDAVETVLFLRDEMADLAWAVEARVEDDLSATIDRRAIWVGHRRLSPPGDPAKPAYRVETVVPDYWIPLAPEQLGDQQSIRLRLVPMEADDGGNPRTIEPRGVLLRQDGGDGRLWIFEEEIPREGIIVDRINRYARWQGGRAACWTARRRRTGRGEGSSGLRFDILDPG